MILLGTQKLVVTEETMLLGGPVFEDISYSCAPRVLLLLWGLRLRAGAGRFLGDDLEGWEMGRFSLKFL